MAPPGCPEFDFFNHSSRKNPNVICGFVDNCIVHLENLEWVYLIGKNDSNHQYSVNAFSILCLTPSAIEFWSVSMML